MNKTEGKKKEKKKGKNGWQPVVTLTAVTKLLSLSLCALPVCVFLLLGQQTQKVLCCVCVCAPVAAAAKTHKC
jgi:hypothetical protein